MLARSNKTVFHRAPSAAASPYRAAALAGCVIAGSVVASCAVGPDFVSPDAPKGSAYTAEKVELAVPGSGETKQELALGAKVPQDWWALYHSPQLDRVLQQAIADNRSVAAAKATLTQAQALVTQVDGQRYPQVNFTSTGVRQRSNFAGSDVDQKGPTANFFSLGPTVSFALDIFGGLRRQSERQEALAEFQDYQLSAAYLTLTGNVVTQAVQIASIRAQIAAVDEIIAHDEQNIASVDTLFRVQEATRLDVQSAASQLATDRTQLPPLRQALGAARHALAVLVGQAPVEWKAPDFDLDELKLPETLPITLPSELVHQRPDILAAEAQLHASSAAVGIATAQLYPNLTLSGGISQQAISTASLFTPAANIWNIAANLTAPIFNGFSLTAAKEAAEADFKATLLSYEQTVLQSFQQVADLLDALEHDAEQVEYQGRALESTKASVELSHTSYAAGESKLIDVLDAERLYQQARLGYVRAMAQRLQDTTQLFVAMGGGWRDWRAAETAAAPEPPTGKDDGKGILKAAAQDSAP